MQINVFTLTSLHTLDLDYIQDSAAPGCDIR